MAGVSESIVREFFELHGFLIRQERKYISPNRTEARAYDFLVLNPAPQPGAIVLPFILEAADMLRLTRAVVVVKGWHTETFSPARLTNAPEIFRFLEPSAFKRASRAFGDGPLTKILVVPALPHSAEARRKSIGFLQGKGVDAVIPFRTMLDCLIQHTETNRNYQKSDLLQIIRILKNYEFFREPQLELFKSRRPPPSRSG